MKNNSTLIYKVFLVIGDFVALIGAFSLAYIFRVSLDHQRITTPITALHYLETFLVIMPFFILLFSLIGLYNKDIYEQRLKELGRLIVGCFIGVLFIISYGYLADHPIFPAKLVIAYGLLIAVAFELIFRSIARGIRRLLFRFNYGINNVVILGNTRTTKELIGVLANSSKTGYKVVAVVGNIKPLNDQCQIFSSFDEFENQSNLSVHTIIQTELYSDQRLNSAILTFSQENHIEYHFFPGNSNLFVGNLSVEIFHGIPLIEVQQTALIGWGKVIKRLTDLVFGVILLILFSPIMLIIALVIQSTDGRPIFYRQKRLTRYNQTFKVYKFRTLYRKYNAMSPEAAFRKMNRPELISLYRKNGDYLDNDPRIIPIGKFMRKFSLDELPQIINIIRGDISLVGPRALVPEELDIYTKKHLILSVKSGLTGLAQISGRKSITFDERRKLDVYYVQNWTFWSDIVILTKTIWIVITGKGAK